MATKPTFSTGQDMTDVSPADVAEAKARTKATAAYDKTASTPASTASAPKKYASGGNINGHKGFGIAKKV
jgi:hypothetical protein